MQAKVWKKVNKILCDVLEIETSERQKYLDKLKLDSAIRAEVISLLTFEEKAEDFMSLSANDISKDFLPTDEIDEISLVGQKIGVYEIKKELGYGGMGAVYLADRCDGKFEQKAAVKMLRREFNTEKIRQHFQREKEILALLDYPHISRLLDAGTTGDGVPYLVMDYIEGVPIDVFCRENVLSLNDRLKLFNKVCEAVSFAHRNLIIHRDLKPSNILVTQNGEPKLLDFGISKLLDVEATEEHTLTNLGAMTPEYASPEQIKGETVSTATDIYSLGVILYKLLTAKLPFDLKGKTDGELLQIITEHEPTLPSNSFGDREKGRQGEGETGNLSSKISPSPCLPVSPSQLQGDLDNIVLKSLRKEPELRYQTVEQFAEDIWRFLDGMPVLARPMTLAYRASKFIKRNRMAVIAVAFVFLSLIIGIGTALWQAREARAQARQSAIESEKAKEEQRKSEKVTKFVSKIFGYANPGWFAEGAKTEGKARVIDVVEELSDKIDTEFANEADVAAELHNKFAEIFHWVAKKTSTDEQREIYRQKSRYHALRGLELRRAFYGEYHELVAKDLFSAYSFIGTTDEEHAKALMEGILMMRETNPKNLNYPYMFEAYAGLLILPEYEKSHEAYRNAVIPPTDENKYQIAERMLREALTVWHLYYPPDHDVILGRNCWLAYTLAKQDKWAEFGEPYQICKQLETKQVDRVIPNEGDKNLELVEKVLAEKGRRIAE